LLDSDEEDKAFGEEAEMFGVRKVTEAAPAESAAAEKAADEA
jgi:hypothetical protein